MESRRDIWIRSWAWDSFWILGGLPAGLILWAVCGPGAGGQTVLFLWVLCWGGHALSPILLSWNHPELRKQVAINRKRLVFFPIFLVLSCSLLAGLSVAGYARFPDVKNKSDLINGIIVLWIIQMFWNVHHFSKQTFGLLSIYRLKFGGYSRRQRIYDLCFCHLNNMTLVLVVWYALDSRYFVLVGKYLPKLGVQTSFWLAGVGILLSLGSLGLILLNETWLERKFCIPRLALLVTTALSPCLAVWSQTAFFGNYMLGHFLPAMGLASHVLASSRQRQHAGTRWSSRPVYLSMLLIAISIPTFVFLRAEGMLGNQTRDFAAVVGASAFLAVLVGLRFALGFTHFLYDGSIFRFREPGIREIMKRDLFRT